MNKVIKIIITILIIIESVFMYLTYKSFINKPSNINEVAVKDTEKVPINNNSFAIMLENTNGTYSPSTDRTKWPDTNNYAYYYTECYDGDGKEATNAIATFNAATKKFTLSADTSTYCYIKFANKKGSMGKLLTSTYLETEEARQQNRPNDTLRRFQSTDPSKVTNNYICFGTNVTNTCTGNTYNYMYRIIGVVSQDDEVTGEKVGMLKVIKKDALNTAYSRHTSTGGTSWEYTMLYKQLNGIHTGSSGKDAAGFSSYIFLTNSTFVPNEEVGSKTWNAVIETINWRNGGCPTKETGAAILEREVGPYAGPAAKIGLIRVSDYFLAYDNVTEMGFAGAPKSWISAAEAGANTPATYEWIGTGSNCSLTRDGRTDIANSDSNKLSVRPVFYLTRTIQLKGSGTATDPYIIVSA